jgi:hypothetical protein
VIDIGPILVRRKSALAENQFTRTGSGSCIQPLQVAGRQQHANGGSDDGIVSTGPVDLGRVSEMAGKERPQC